MWYFNSPRIVFGEDALAYLEQIEGQRAFIVTDACVQALGFVDMVQQRLSNAGLECCAFTQVEPEPSFQMVKLCAKAMEEYRPDWVVGLGGGSCMDAAKAAWFLYERPDIELEAINPVEQFGLRSKARLLTIPTTAGSGSEATHAAVVSDLENHRKLELVSNELLADITIVDPIFSSKMPPQLTADTGIDVLVHAVESFNNTFSNDFCDGLSLQAIRLVFDYLPRAVELGESDMEAREKMANAAAIAGITIANSNISLAHAMGHSAGAIFGIPHGRVTAIFLPPSIEYFCSRAGSRYMPIAHLLGLPTQDEPQAADGLANAVRGLMKRIHLPLSLQQAGVPGALFEAELEALCDRAEVDLGMVTAHCIPDREGLKRIFVYAYEGRSVDF